MRIGGWWVGGRRATGGFASSLVVDRRVPLSTLSRIKLTCLQVGLCAITSANTIFEKVFATDLATHRLTAAKKHGAIALPKEELLKAVMDATEGRGADAVLELVGHESALLTAMEFARPYGVISVGGVHHAPVTLSGATLYNKKCVLASTLPG